MAPDRGNLQQKIFVHYKINSSAFCLIDLLCLLDIMDGMIMDNAGQSNNLKDTGRSISKYYGSQAKFLSYTKLNKLITALYMVTDIMDSAEPLRVKLRTLGADLITDTYFLAYRTDNIHGKIGDKISEILSFLEVASGVGMISEMNSNILKREFQELRNSVFESNTDITKTNPTWLEEFMKYEEKDDTHFSSQKDPRDTLTEGTNRTRIGVQKGATLMKALSEKIPNMPNGNTVRYENNNRHQNNEHKNKRREVVISIIKDKMNMSLNFEGMTITDIKSIGHEGLADCGEKTLQRELVSMVADGVLKKTGEKRWSKYSLK